jgi:NitT/TauT family transport system permease protein
MATTTEPGGHVEHTDLDALDALELAPIEAGQPRWRRVAAAVLPPLFAAVFVLTVWQLVVWSHVVSTLKVPSPGTTWSELVDQWRQGNITDGIRNSLSRGALGFVAAVVIGTPLGLVVARVKFIRAAFGPILSGLQSLPSVAWVPAAIIWFGLSNAAIYAVVLLGAVPSIANGLLGGMKQVPPLFDRVGRVLGLSTLARTRYVLLPAALPGYLGGLRQGWAFAWRSLMAAELITYSPDLGQGLGQLLDVGRELSQMSLVITAIGLILAVGMAIELLLFAPLERRVLSRRGLTVR